MFGLQVTVLWRKSPFSSLPFTIEAVGFLFLEMLPISTKLHGVMGIQTVPSNTNCRSGTDFS
jgi:hypothetical protein